MLNQNQIPLVSAIKEVTTRPDSPFYTPGHKRGVGISPHLADLLGKTVFTADLTELAELDHLFSPEGAIKTAQELAAQAFGAKQTWFLVNGSTCGIVAAILATCGVGDKIILPRNVHSSVISGLILSGADPIFLFPEYDQTLDIAHSVTPQGVETALQQHPDAKAVMVVYPTYYGVCGDLAAIAQITHQYNIPLLVDEAHGAHFAFHPKLPIPALVLGADLTVQSIHKTLGALTQASMLHIQGNRIDIDRLNKALQLVQSTSPSYLLLASLDAARHQMAIHGEALMRETLELAQIAKTQIAQITGLSTPLDQQDKSPGFMALDPTRLTVMVSELGLTGFAAEEIISETFGVIPEFSSIQHLTFIISLGNVQSDIEKLVYALKQLVEMCPEKKQVRVFPDQSNIFWSHEMCVSPRTAFFAKSEVIPLEQAYGRISAETICPYPPGIPVIMAGVAIAKQAGEYLRQIQALGGLITGCEDYNLENIKVLKI